MKNLELVTLEDWVVVLVDGENVYENHSVSNLKLLQLIGIPFTRTDMDGKTDEELEDYINSGGAHGVKSA